MALTWTEKYSIGVKEIDNHHQQLFSLLNSNLKSVIEKSGESKMNTTDLALLQEYALSHLRAEEDMFLKVQYPDAATHIQEHDEFRKNLQKLHALANKSDDIERLKLLLFLSTWFTKHVLTLDKDYVPYLNKK